MLHLLHAQFGDEAHSSFRANSIYGVAFDIVGLSGVRGARAKWLWLLVAVPIRSLFHTWHQEFYFVEIDGERPREAELLAKWLKPEVTLWVSVGRSHAAYFDKQVSQGLFPDVETAIVHEFAWLPKMTKKLVVIDGSDKKMVAAVADIGIDVIEVHRKDLHAYEVIPNATRFKTAGGEFVFPIPLPKEMYVQLRMLEIVCEYLGDKTNYALKSFTIPPSRSNYFEGAQGVHIIDSTYNAHLISMESTLGMLKAMPVLRKWIVIGDIIEQGKGEADEHRRLAELLLTIPVDRYILVGRRTKKYTYPVLKQHTQSICESFENPGDALAYLQQELKGSETVLFKGSQYLEGIIEPLLEHPEDADRLCRRESIYRRRRMARGLPG